MVQTHKAGKSPASEPRDVRETEVLAREDKVIWPAAFHEEIPLRLRKHPPIRPKPQELKLDFKSDPYAYLLVCPACDSVVNSVKCKLVCPNCHAIVQSCCD